MDTKSTNTDKKVFKIVKKGGKLHVYGPSQRRRRRDKFKRERYHHSGGGAGNKNDIEKRRMDFEEWSDRKIEKKKGRLDFNENHNAPFENIIYLDTDDDELAENYYNSFVKLMLGYDFEIVSEGGIIKGSWIRRTIFRAKKFLSNKEVKKNWGKIQRGIELKHLEALQSEVNSKEMDTIAKFTQSSEKIPNVAHLAGDLLLIKVTLEDGVPIHYSQKMTQNEIVELKSTPQIFYKPTTLLRKVEELNSRKTIKVLKAK